MHEHELRGPTGAIVEPEKPCGTGVLVLAGSSGRVDDARCRLLAGCSQRNGEQARSTWTSAGHRALMPGEHFTPARSGMVYGGSPAADAELGALAWPAIVAALQLSAGVSTGARGGPVS